MLTRRRRLPIAMGTVGQAIVVSVAFYLAVVGSYFDFLSALAISVVAWGLLWAFSHCLAHYIVGRFVGITFDYYFIGRSAMRHLNLPLLPRLAESIPAMGIKTNRQSMQTAAPQAKARMFRAGALTSMLLPFTIPTINVLADQQLVGIIMFAISVANLTFTTYFSPRAGDFQKASSALKTA